MAAQNGTTLSGAAAAPMIKSGDAAGRKQRRLRLAAQVELRVAEIALAIDLDTSSGWGGGTSVVHDRR